MEYTNSKGVTYYLHQKEVTLRGSGRVQVIYYFARDRREGILESLPEGFVVIESSRTGLPVLKRA